MAVRLGQLGEGRVKWARRSAKVGPHWHCHSDPDMHCSQMNGSIAYRPAREHHSTS